MPVIYTVTLNPALDVTFELKNIDLRGVNRADKTLRDPAGKGVNVSKYLLALGIGSVAVGLIAGETGRGIESALNEMGIETDFVGMPGETRINVKLHDAEKGTYADLCAPGPVTDKSALDEMESRLTARVKQGDICVLAGSVPSGCQSDVYAHLTQRLKEKGALVCLDADGDALREGLKELPYFIKPNREELARAGADVKSLLASGIEEIALSMGAEGALFYQRGGEIFRAEAIPVPVAATAGAGDAMMAAMVCGLCRGDSFESRCRLAVALASAKVSTPGTRAPDSTLAQALLPRVSLHKEESI